MTTLKEWLAKLNAYKERIKRGEELTPEEKEHMDFLQQKYDDWRTD